MGRWYFKRTLSEDLGRSEDGDAAAGAGESSDIDTED